MCKFPRYRYPAVNVEPRHKKMGLGWSENSRAFIFDKRKVDVLETLLVLYPRTADYLQEIPCGQCMECRISTSKELAQRALAEATCHEENYFITLTYDDEHLLHTFKNTVSRKTGEPGFYPSLIKKDFQDFAKRLRERIRYKTGQSDVMIFPCGEYGDLNGRPHFHFIAYNLPIKDDLKFFRDVTLKGHSYEYLTSPLIEDCWQKGFITVAEVNWETCAYVARYVTKKMIGKSEKDYLALCKDLGLEPQQREYHEAPKRPGLGLRYYEANKDHIYELDQVVLPGGKSMKPCSYYDKKFDVDNPELLRMNKLERQKRAQVYRTNKYKGFTPSQVEKAEKAQHEIFERKIKRLARSL